jgi:hypothetical protein
VNKPKKDEQKDASQSKRFIDTAHSHEASEAPDAFEAALDAILKPPKKPDDSG